ncbi:MAG TPA: glucose-6-phosphate dehydrogenase assembly protein OpcA [Candidatus Dormibacteraeota bacterium]|jgi:glucose-6-phosphate dehydrogenase assembly protein OpcA|nr:glucose-6-phosphate dehydrogenase assembly protein OpcA [Candidatus Dormibacteraeota bacterium]
MLTASTPLQVSHASGLHAVNRVLAEMHREMLRSGGIEGAAVRLSVLNLVAACVDVESADMASQAVGRLGAKHPARAIIIVATPDGRDQIEADLSLQCSATDSGQVCAEQVRLHVGGEVAYHLASVVTPLLVPDIPVYLWLVGAPPLRQAFGQDAVAISERVIIDSGEYHDAGTLRTLSEELVRVGNAIAISDVAWERTRMWRELIAQSFDGEDVRPFVHGITRVDLECGGDHVSAQTWLIAGWLASRLGWAASPRQPEVVAAFRATAEVADRDLIRAALRCHVDGHQALVTLERRGSALYSVIDVDGGITAERAVPITEPDTVDLVGRLLEVSGEDPVYRDALRSAAVLSSAR